MQIETLAYEPGAGWSPQPFPPLDSARTLVVTFGAGGYGDSPEPILELRRAFPLATMIGCSTAGEILDAQVYDGRIVAAVCRFARTEVRGASVAIRSGADAAAGSALAQRLAGPDLRAVLVLSEGLLVNGSALVAGINAKLPEAVIVTGGLAADGDRFQRTWVLHDGRILRRHVCAVGLYGTAVRVGHGSCGGWQSFGPERLVTRADGNVLQELDGRPALALYKDYLGDLADGLPAAGLRFPLGLRASEDDHRLLVRTILATDPGAGSMTFAGDMPEGYRARLMRASLGGLIEGAKQAARQALARGGPGTALAVAISCVGRRMMLGERSDDELEATLDTLPGATTQIGFYSYGELSPFDTGSCDLHNQTMTLTSISEIDPG